MATLLKLGAALAILALTGGEALAEPPAAQLAPPPEIAVTRVDRLRITALVQAGSRLVAAGERGRVLISDDEGKSWQNAASPSSAGLNAIAFSDKFGIVVGHNATLLRSEDGGKTWAAIDLAAKDQPALFAVYAHGDQAIAVGAYAAYFESKDAGKTWARRNIGTDDFDKHLTGIASLGEGRLLIAGEAGTLLASKDGGQSWAALKSPYAGSYFGILGLKFGGVIIYGMRGHAYESADVGAHWQRIDLGGQQGAIQGGRELDDGRVLLYGNDGLLAIRTRAADPFKIEREKRRRTLAAALPIGERFLIAGPNGLGWSGQERAAK